MEAFKVVIAGHVDHGKSTLIGKILNDSSQVLEDRYKKIENICKSKSMKFEYAFLLDAFEEEQKQGITIDKLEIPWVHEEKRYIFIDTPGHKEFINNMVSGSSNAHIAIILIDAKEGIQEQTRQHIAVLNLFGIKKLIVLFNKMDLIKYDQKLYENHQKALEIELKKFPFTEKHIIPISAYEGNNIFSRTDELSWYQGPTLIEALDTNHSLENLNKENSFKRLSIQDVYKFDDKRIYAGIVLSGELSENYELTFSAGSKSIIKSFEEWNTPSARTQYRPNDVVSFTLNDSLFLVKGEIASWNSPPPKKSHFVTLSTFWFSMNTPRLKHNYTFKIANQKHSVEILEFREIAAQLFQIKIKSSSEIVYDFFEDCESLGRGIIIDDFNVVGASVIQQSLNESAIESNHNSETLKGVVWLTGLSGSGKTTIAQELKRSVEKTGTRVVILDGDELRRGLNSDLGFSEEDRHEQARRTACMAEILCRQNIFVIVALISPKEAFRQTARDILKDFPFHEIFIKVPIEECHNRDVKGLYKMAQSGKVEQLTGISAAYEEPTSPDLTVDNFNSSIEESCKKILKHLGF